MEFARQFSLQGISVISKFLSAGRAERFCAQLDLQNGMMRAKPHPNNVKQDGSGTTRNRTVCSATLQNLQATILHLFGIDHERLTYKYQGRRFRLTDVHGEVVSDIVA